MGMAKTVLISVGVKTSQESVTGVVGDAAGDAVAVGSGVEEWQPRSRRVVARRAESGVVDIFAGLPSGGASLVVR